MNKYLNQSEFCSSNNSSLALPVPTTLITPPPARRSLNYGHMKETSEISTFSIPNEERSLLPGTRPLNAFEDARLERVYTSHDDYILPNRSRITYVIYKDHVLILS